MYVQYVRSVLLARGSGKVSRVTETLWQQVHDGLRDRITSGELTGRLPSEPQLMAAYGVRSRSTIKTAVDALIAEGLVGRNRRVIERRPVTLRVSDEESVQFVADLLAAGHTTTDPDITVDHRGGDLVRTVLREVDGEPHNWAEWVFPLKLFAGTRLDYDTDIPEGSVRYVKEGQGWTGLVQEKWIEARMPTPEETAVLKMNGGPVIVEHRTGSQDGTALFCSVRILRADRTRLVP